MARNPAKRNVMQRELAKKPNATMMAITITQRSATTRMGGRGWVISSALSAMRVSGSVPGARIHLQHKSSVRWKILNFSFNPPSNLRCGPETRWVYCSYKVKVVLATTLTSARGATKSRGPQQRDPNHCWDSIPNHDCKATSAAPQVLLRARSQPEWLS